jgi:predicted AlkP superfamily pyrophosphatase or phosphodiesterase
MARCCATTITTISGSAERMTLRRVVIGCALGSTLLLALPPVRAQSAAPRLLVVVMVDQMRADYLALFDRHWKAGFRTLLREGAVFENAAYPYANTVTCAGHATVSTGTFPRTHGIVGNAWWSREDARLVDCSIDTNPASAHISYGRPAKSGNGPHLLLVPTLGDELRRQRTGSHVVSLSLKPDAATMLAGHGGDVVTWLDSPAGAFVTSRAYGSAPAPALVEFFNTNPLRRELSGTWTLLENADTYVNADAITGERPPVGRDGVFPHEIGGLLGPNARSLGFWQQSPRSDEYLARMAAAIVDAVALGRDDVPDFLGIGFSALDLVGHSFGPGSREVEDVLVHLDRTLGTLIEVLDKRVGRDRYVLALTADHGVAPVPAPPRGGRVSPAEIEQRINELLEARGIVSPARYPVAVRGPYVYFASGVLERLRADPTLQHAVGQTISEVAGVSRVLTADQLSATSADDMVRAAALSYMAGRSGDLVIIPQPGWLLLSPNVATATTHGTPYDYDRRVPLILFGSGIKAGRFTQSATPADIAPTLAGRAGIKLPSAEGRVLREALK